MEGKSVKVYGDWIVRYYRQRSKFERTILVDGICQSNNNP